MKNIRQYFIIIIISLFSILKTFGQKEELQKYLDAYKTKEFDESKKIIRDYSFDGEAAYTMFDYNSISGLLFDTDVTEIKGYKAIVNCKLETNGKQIIDKRMMVVMYYDKTRKTWAVYGIREVADATYEYKVAKENVEAKIFYTKKEYSYRGLAYWCMMSGHLQDANKYIEIAITEAASSKNSSFTTDLIKILNAIR